MKICFSTCVLVAIAMGWLGVGSAATVGAFETPGPRGGKRRKRQWWIAEGTQWPGKPPQGDLSGFLFLWSLWPQGFGPCGIT